jgi:hypothetical protein
MDSNGINSPLITLHGRPLNQPNNNTNTTNDNSTNNQLTPRALFTKQRALRSSPRSSPRKFKVASPVSRLPVAQNRFTVKSLRLPPLEETETPATDPSIRVTPEKLLEELRSQFLLERLNSREFTFKEYDNERNELERDNENDTYGTYDACDTCDINTSYNDNENSPLPRMSLRNRGSIVVDAPDLVYQDPLEVARQTLQNTRANSGYRKCKLIYTTERRIPRPNSPEPAFSKKTGIARHFINLIDQINEEEKFKLRFDRVLKLFDSPSQFEDFDQEVLDELLHKHPEKSCLKPQPTTPTTIANDSADKTQSKTQIVEIKRICYDGDEDLDDLDKNSIEISSRKRKLKGAKRLKRID